jgi:hypothetical protein
MAIRPRERSELPAVVDTIEIRYLRRSRQIDNLFPRHRRESGAPGMLPRPLGPHFREHNGGGLSLLREFHRANGLHEGRNGQQLTPPPLQNARIGGYRASNAAWRIGLLWYVGSGTCA